MFYVTVRAEFDFVSTEDGSIHTVVTYGEAMDSGDKATNKAMSIAYKYAAFQRSASLQKRRLWTLTMRLIR